MAITDAQIAQMLDLLQQVVTELHTLNATLIEAKDQQEKAPPQRPARQAQAPQRRVTA